MTWLIRLNTMSHDSLEEIFSFVVKVAAHMDGNGGNAYELFEICSAEGHAIVRFFFFSYLFLTYGILCEDLVKINGVFTSLCL
ncbi:hypothetical protein HanRHA438_Chr02g0065151 [Helianthus annuus]|nr:hypothetical protein HanRHA438_Chr02g0065151 [Helianthus annuus]